MIDPFVLLLIDNFHIFLVVGEHTDMIAILQFEYSFGLQLHLI